MGGKRNHIKMLIYTESGLEFNILKVTICEQKACNRVTVNVSIYLLIVEYSFSFFHTSNTLLFHYMFCQQNTLNNNNNSVFTCPI